VATAAGRTAPPAAAGTPGESGNGGAAVECGRCQAGNREGRRFCGECGFPLSTACPSCGFANEGHERFCGGCGRPLAAPASASEPEVQSPPAHTPKQLSERRPSSPAALEGVRKPGTRL